MVGDLEGVSGTVVFNLVGEDMNDRPVTVVLLAAVGSAGRFASGMTGTGQ